MSTFDRILKLLDEQGKKQKELTDYLGISKNSFTDWKSGRIKSYTKHISKIAEFLGVSSDYLLGNSPERWPIKSDMHDTGKNIIKIAGRDGSFKERTLTDDQLDLLYKMIEQLPDANDL